MEAQQNNVRKVLLVSQDDAERINDYRFSGKIRTEGEAIRQIIRRGLKSVEAEKESTHAGE